MFKHKYLALLIALSSPFATFMPAQATEKEEYDAGVAAYAKKDYATAADKFWNSVVAGNATPLVYLYMAHAHAGNRNILEALNNYHTVVDIGKGTPEAQLAAACIKRMDPQGLWRRGQPLPKALEPPPLPATAAPAAAVVETKSSNAGAPQATMVQRISISPPKHNHPAVSADTIKTVRTMVQALPAALSKTLVDGGANIFIMTNSSDKWPESIDQVKSGDTTYAMELGHCYGRDMYIYERPSVEKGSLSLGSPHKPEEIRWVTANQLFHGVDNCTNISKDPEYLKAYKQDADHVPDDARGAMADYIAEGAGPGETFAEIGTGLIGVKGANTGDVLRYFATTKAVVQKKLRI